MRWSARIISTLPTKVVTSLSKDSAESPSITRGDLKRNGSSTAKSWRLTGKRSQFSHGSYFKSPCIILKISSCATANAGANTDDLKSSSATTRPSPRGSRPIKLQPQVLSSSSGRQVHPGRLAIVPGGNFTGVDSFKTVGIYAASGSTNSVIVGEIFFDSVKGLPLSSGPVTHNHS